jgi:hypothetical protein
VGVYSFAIRNADGSEREDTGRMVLGNDHEARAFGDAVIKDMVLGDAARYTGWTMEIARGARPVCSIPFP